MVIFRCDGNRTIGVGHIMRCLSIADTFCGLESSNRCIFITADDTFATVINEHGHDNTILYTDYRNMDYELPKIEKLLYLYKPQFFFVDSYFVSVFYLTALREFCNDVGCKLVYIDDIFAFAYPCDILINYNIYGERAKYKALYQEAKRMEPRLLLGTRYVPLRQEFQNISKRIVNKEAYNILISTGGSDPAHIASNIAKYIVNHRELFSNIYFDFVIGKLNDDLKKLEKFAELNQSIRLHVNVSSMQKLMSSVDLAISAAGSTLYELCATQTPTITYVLADNQVAGAEEFVRQGILKSVGDLRKIGNNFPKKLTDAAIELARDYQERCRISKLQKILIDGKGAKRILKNLWRDDKIE